MYLIWGFIVLLWLLLKESIENCSTSGVIIATTVKIKILVTASDGWMYKTPLFGDIFGVMSKTHVSTQHVPNWFKTLWLHLLSCLDCLVVFVESMSTSDKIWMRKLGLSTCLSTECHFMLFQPLSHLSSPLPVSMWVCCWIGKSSNV